MANVVNDKYELIEVLNASVGDFDGESYKARERSGDANDAQPGRVVLLRRLPADSNVPNVLEAAKRGAALPRHPNILEPYGIVQLAASGGIPAGIYAVSEFVRGISLRERIRRVAPFSLAVSLDIASAIAQALTFAGEQGLVHGHLSAEEVLLTPEGQVKVADFAFGQAIHEAVHSDTYIPGNDIKALGLILFEMLTGAPPAHGDGSDAFSPRLLNQNVPPAIDGITRKALTTDIRGKYTSAATLLTDLQNAREDLRAGKPLTWTPVANPTPAKPQPKQASGLLTQAANELDKESKKANKRDEE